MEATVGALPQGLPTELSFSEQLPFPHVHTNSQAASDNLERAEQLLLDRRDHDPAYKAPLSLTRMFSIKRKVSSEPTFSYKEANRALLSIVDSNGDSGVANALLTSLGADVNVDRHRSSSAWKKVAQKNQVETRSEVLAHAATVARPDLVVLLAAHADQTSLDAAMGEAIRRADLDILRTLIDRGASPLRWHVDFLDAVSSGRNELVALLLSGQSIRPCVDCLSKSLALTVDNGCLDNLQLLVDCGADADFNSGEALSAAARTRKAESVAILLAGPLPPSMRSLDLALSVSYGAMVEPAESHDLEIMAGCLAAGAQGPNLDQILVAAVRKKQSAVLDLLLQHSKAMSVNHDSGVAIPLALEYEQLDVLGHLLAVGPSRATLSAVIGTAMSTQSPAFRLESMSRILDRGACGVDVAEALVTAVEHISGHASQSDVLGPETRLIRLLLAHADVDIDHSNGKALRLAIETAPEHIVARLLDMQPDVRSLVAAFPAAIALADKDNQLRRVKMLMAGGARGDVVDQALIQAVDGGGSTNRETIEVFLMQSSVNYCEGQVLIHCIRALDTDTLRLLLAKGPNQTAISTAARAAFSLSGPQRHSFFELLVTFLSPGDLGIGLFQLSREADLDLALIRKLLEAGARVEHQGGVCLVHAASTYHSQLLELLGAFAKDEALYSQAFGSALDASANWTAIDNMPVFQYLLNHGARGKKISDAVGQAASKFEFGMLQALADCIGVNNDIFSSAYVVATTQSPAWLDIKHSDTMELLLAHGATGEAVAKSLSLAITALAKGRTSESLVDILLGGNVDVNYELGAAVQLAARYGLLDLLDKLMDAGGNSESASRALITAIQASHSETLLLQIVDTLMDHTSALPDVNFAHTDAGSPLYLCLERYPESMALVTKFIDIGCDLQRPGAYCAIDVDEGPSREHRAGLREQLEDDDDADEWYHARDDARCNSSTAEHELREPVTVLMYALMQTDNMISSDIINTLILRGGK